MDTLEQDYHNFSTSSSHKLPTLSGTQAIRNVIENAQPILTSLSSLDAILGRSPTIVSPTGGLQRGVVTEVCGPPGVGKTTFALQAAVNAIHASGAGHRVTWIDTFSQLVPFRLHQLAEGYQTPSELDLPSSPPQPQGSKEALLDEKVDYLQITSLPNLLALLLHPGEDFPPAGTSFVVLDDLSNLVLSSLPRATGSATKTGIPATPSAVRDSALSKRTLTRRFQVLSSLSSGLQKFAVAKNVAVLVTSKVAANLKAGQKALLRPAMASQQWDVYLSTRIVLYRGFWPEEAFDTQDSTDNECEAPTEFDETNLRFAKVVRLGGKLVSAPEIGFVIEEKGLREVQLPNQRLDGPLLPMATQPLPALEDILHPEIESKAALAEYPSDDEDDDETSTQDIAPQTPLQTKRKAIEIADSDEEDSDSASDISLPPIPTHTNGFQPSSQILRSGADGEDGVLSETSVKKVRVTDHRIMATGSQEEHDQAQDEMLLETYERKIPYFSQVAAEMSEPLTPSDYGDDPS